MMAKSKPVWTIKKRWNKLQHIFVGMSKSNALLMNDINTFVTFSLHSKKPSHFVEYKVCMFRENTV